MANHRPLIKLKFQEYLGKFPEYSIGEILYSMLVVHGAGKDFKRADFLTISDEEIYEALSRSFALETEVKEES